MAEKCKPCWSKEEGS